MERVDADPAAREGAVELSVTPVSGIIEPEGDVTANEFDLDELLAYRGVPPRQGRTVAVHVRPGSRLGPLPYPLEEGDS
jgi:hypothetical protein